MTTLLERSKKMARLHRVRTDDLEGLTPKAELDAIQSRLNHAVFSNAHKWMLPSWAIERLRAKATDTSQGAITNDRRDDWACIGGVGARHQAFADSRGLVSTGQGTGSIDVWLKEGNDIVFPALADASLMQLSLTSPDEPVFSMSHTIGPLTMTRLIYHVTEDGHEAIYNEIQIRNVSLEAAETTFYVVIRPISLLGVEPIETLELLPQASSLYANGLLALELSKLPKSVVMTTADNPNLLRDLLEPSARMDTSFSTARGLATAVLRYDVQVRPAGSVELFFASPLEQITAHTHRKLFGKTSSERDQTVAGWYDFHEAVLKASFPESALDPILLQSEGLLAKSARSVLLDPAWYLQGHNWCDAARILLALCGIGAGDLAESISEEIASAVLQNTLRVGQSEIAPYAWTMAQVYQYSCSARLLKMLQPDLHQWVDGIRSMVPSKPEPLPEPTVAPEAGLAEAPKSTPVSEAPVEPVAVEGSASAAEAEWVAKLRAEMDQISKTGEPGIETPVAPTTPPPAPPVPVAPPTPSVDLKGITRSLWSVAALRAISRLAEDLHEDQLVGDIRAVEETEHVSLDAAMRILKDNSGQLGSMLESAEGATDALVIISSFGIIGTGLLDVSSIRLLFEAVQEKLVKNNLLRAPGEAGYYSSYLGLRLAQVQCLMKNRDAVGPLMRAALRLLGRHHVLPECTDLKIGGSALGEGCSTLAAADLVLLLRTMFAFEDGSDLIILAGIPDEWFTATVPLSVTRIHTTSGRVSVDVGTSANQHQIEVRMEYLPQELEIHVPTSRALPMVKVYGAGVAGRFQDEVSPRIRVVPLSDDVVVTFHKS